MTFSDFLENKLLDHAFRNTTYTPPTTLYLALFTAAPTDAGPGSGEVSTTSTGYARQSITPSTGFSAASGGSIANTGTVSFSAATASWGTITHFAIFDALSGTTNMLAWGALSASKTVGSGDTASFAAGQLTITLD